jgi:peptide/nickel transport system substrate-binding protein
MDAAEDTTSRPQANVPLSRRAALQGLSGIAIVTLLAACGPATPASPAASGPTSTAAAGAAQKPAPVQQAAPTQAPVGQQPATPQAASAAPKTGGTLRFLARLTPPNVAYYGGGFGMLVLGNPVYDQLMSVDVSDPAMDYRVSEKLLPRLAASWEAQADGLAYTFHLRRNVRWHDGNPFTAQDVLATFGYVQNAKNAFPEKGLVVTVDRVEAPDDFTIKVSLKRRDADFLNDLSRVTNGLRILPKHLLENPEMMQQTMIGTGPFKVESNDLSKATVYVRNPEYWETGKPYVDSIVIRHKLDRSAESAAFAARQLDVIYPADKNILNATKGTVPDLVSAPVVQDLGSTYIPNMKREPFGDVRVRRAMHLAIDRHAMNQALSQGEGVINPPGVWGLKEGWIIPRNELMTVPGFRQAKDEDVAQAKQLLADAGKTSFRTSVIFPRSYNTAPIIGQVVAESWRKIGIQLDLQAMEDAAYLAALTQGDYDIAYESNFSASPTAQWRNHLTSTGSLNNHGVSDPDLDRVIEQQAQELEAAKRKQIWIDLQRALLEKLYIIPLVDQANYAAWQPWVHDLRYSLSANVILPSAQNIWIDTASMPAQAR